LRSWRIVLQSLASDDGMFDISHGPSISLFARVAQTQRIGDHGDG
jgi:hypothetical protein